MATCDPGQFSHSLSDLILNSQTCQPIHHSIHEFINVDMYIYIYIMRERERERERYNYKATK